MPLYDYECHNCEYTFEVIARIEETVVPCPKCERAADRIISVSGAYTGNEDAPWIRSVADVIECDSDNKHDQRFLQSNKTRGDLKRWMKGRGLRHMEAGEKPIKRTRFDLERHTEKVMEKRKERNRIEI